LLEAQTLQNAAREHVFARTSLPALVNEAAARFAQQADAKQIRIEVRAAAAVPDLDLDRASMADVLGNLLDNAIKYSPPGTVVSVFTAATSSCVQIDVCDEGVGIDPAERARIFDPFVRGRRGDLENVHGTGLGLSLVKAAVDAHGGTVSVVAREPRGSCFSIRLPVARP
jgi:signal transduction histidine kinase